MEVSDAKENGYISVDKGTFRELLILDNEEVIKNKNTQMEKVRIVCISDTHGFHERMTIPKGDLLLVAGDFTVNGDLEELTTFSNFLSKQKPKFEKIVVIAGN